jgi:hypothetical protein
MFFNNGAASPQTHPHTVAFSSIECLKYPFSFRCLKTDSSVTEGNFHFSCANSFCSKKQLNGGTGNDEIIAKSGTLNSTDKINGGGGINTLALIGAGTFDLRAPGTLANIKFVTAQEGQAASGAITSTVQKVYLRSDSVAEATISEAMTWSEPSRDVKIARDQAIQLMGSGKLYCVWSGRTLDAASLDVDHCFPWAIWPCDDLWNLLPAHRSAKSEPEARQASRRKGSAIRAAAHRGMVGSRIRQGRKSRALGSVHDRSEGYSSDRRRGGAALE